MEFTIDVGELDRAAQQFSGVHGDADRAKSRMGELQIPDGTFGRVPWMSDQLREPYQEHTQACHDALDKVVQALDDLTTAVKTTAASYRYVATQNEEAAGLIVDALKLP